MIEMANVSKNDTGLDYDLWIYSAGIDKKTKHNEPRIKVDVNGNRIPVSISSNPKILTSDKIKGFNKIKDYIIKYENVLLKHWNKEYTDKQALLKLNTINDELDDEDK